MRKVLHATLPLLTIVVIGASFFLLTNQGIERQKVLGSSRLASSTVQKSPVAKVTIKKRVVTSQAVSVKQTPPPIKLMSTPSPTPTPPSTPIKSPPVGGPTEEPTPTQIIKITNTPSPTSVKSALTPTPLPVTPEDSIQSYIMQKINDYRSSQGLSSVSTDSNSCSFAKTRASEIAQSFNHDGFTGRISGHTLPYTSYHEVTENIAMNSDYTQIVSMWISSSGHAENMRKDTPYVCVEKSGNYYAYEGWRP